MPDYSHLPDQVHDSMYTVYGNISEELPDDMPTPLGKPVCITMFVDANLYFDLINGRAVTGILSLVNQTPVDWYSKKQTTVATATFGSEFVAARQATDILVDLRYTLHMLGAPLEQNSYMFGDNKSVVTQSTLPHSKLAKRWYALAYHRVREAVASGFLMFYHIPGTENPADVLTKFLGYQAAWPLLKPLLFWRGETMLQAKGSDRK